MRFLLVVSQANKQTNEQNIGHVCVREVVHAQHIQVFRENGFDCKTHSSQSG